MKSKLKNRKNDYKKHLPKSIAYSLIRVGGILISLISLIPMPWKVRVKWAALIYKITYLNPQKYPTYIEFIEEINAKYDIGKREKGMYLNIFLKKDDPN